MHFGCSSTILDRGNSVHIFSILEDVPDQILQWNTFCSNASCNNLHHMWFNFIPVCSNERGGRYQKFCALESHIIILHEVFIQNGIHPVTIKCSDTCGIIFLPSVFHGKKSPMVKYQNAILNILCKTCLKLKLRHVTSTQLWLQSHMPHMRYISLVYSVYMVCAKSIICFSFRVLLGLINQFDVLTCDESLFTRVLIVNQYTS